MPIKRDVSNSRKQAVILAWHSKCAISGYDNLPLHVDHVVSLFEGGSNEFANLVPISSFINLQKGASRYPKSLETWLLFQAANHEPECIRQLAKLNHKANPLPSDPSKVIFEKVWDYLRPSKDWSLRELKTLVKCYVKYGTQRLSRLVGLIGKTVASARMKLVWLGIYQKEYEGLVT